MFEKFFTICSDIENTLHKKILHGLVEYYARKSSFDIPIRMFDLVYSDDLYS